MNKVDFKPQNVCSTDMEFYIDGNDVISVKIKGGCIGGRQAIARTAEKIKNIYDVIETMGGIVCPNSDNKKTSCAAQLAYGLYLYLLKTNGKELTEFEESIIQIQPVMNLEEVNAKIKKINLGYEKRNNFNKF